MQKVYVYTKTIKDIIFPEDKEIILVNINDFKKHKTIENLFLEDLILTDNDIFISYEHENAVSFRLDKFVIPVNALAIATKNTDLIEVLNHEEENYYEDYQLFSGKKIETIKRETKITVLKSMKLLSEVLYEMLNAGYLEFKNYKKIPDWIVSYEEPTLKLLKIYHKIETSNPAIDFEEEFLINPQFREMNLIMIMKILANFIINNEMITLEEVAKLGSWEEKELWIKLKKKIKLLN